jgi:ParB family transcriptional regulator, chromosome partitioning protein
VDQSDALTSLVNLSEGRTEARDRAYLGGKLADQLRVQERSRRPLGPASVPTDSLRANPHNPRMLFDELPLRTLQASIQQVGILVPLTVYQEKGSAHYTILDGQRRWICAQRLGLPEVPINEVAEPTVAQNIVTMFQIHKLRKDWELMPTALKVGVLMNVLHESREKQLAELTELDVAVVTLCKKLLWYPKKYQDTMLYSDPRDRIKADFFIELYVILTDRLVSRLPWFERDEIIDRFLHKFQNKLSDFKAVTDFRKIKQYITIAKSAGKEELIYEKLQKFIYDDNLSISSLEIDTARIHREAQELTRSVSAIADNIRKLDAREFLGEQELWSELERLLRVVQRQLDAADRRT